MEYVTEVLSLLMVRLEEGSRGEVSYNLVSRLSKGMKVGTGIR